MAKDYTEWFGKEWTELLSPFLNSRDYRRIGDTLVTQVKQGLEITPSFENIFRSFKECPLNHNFHSIIVGQDPYPTKNKAGALVADGIAFSARECMDCPPSLDTLFDALDVQMEGNFVPKQTYSESLGTGTWDLKPWANQGMLLLNCALTTIVGRPNEHLNLWRPFITYVIKALNVYRDSVGVVLMGSHARELKPLMTNPTWQMFLCEHPARAGYENRKWNHNNVLGDLTLFQRKTNNTTIIW